MSGRQYLSKDEVLQKMKHFDEIEFNGHFSPEHTQTIKEHVYSMSFDDYDDRPTTVR